jgi:pyruvate kinase
MAVIGQVMESVASFASAMESIQSLMPAAPAPGSGKKIKTVLEVVKPLACAISEHMPKVAGAIVGMFKKGGAAKDLYKYRHSIKALAGTLEHSSTEV